MRFPVADVLELLASGATHEEIFEDFPFPEEDDIKAALLYAAQRMKNTVILNATH